ncbi:MAG: TetR/AcrR family transcriptional regulator, partial [Clostridia bacterium]|nr:TetR/AcrR family transcriptional regulator [Clostridia bacterium]
SEHRYGKKTESVYISDKARLQARRDLKRKNIIDSCRKTFAENGIEATSINCLCKNAKVNPKVMYDYFASKEEIILACAARSFDFMADIITRNIIDGEGEIISNIDNLIKECYDFRSEICFLYQVVVSPNYNTKIQKFIEPLHLKYDICKQKICDKYGVSMDDVEPIFNILVGAIDYYCLIGDKNAIDTTKKVVYDEIKKIIK